MTKEQKYEAMVKYLVDKAKETEYGVFCECCGLEEVSTEAALSAMELLDEIGVEYD
ncbi:hypothetical protein [Paraglaciecola chathamensis]|uniref:hypothetical protein n=1 Tax=Paraglaciecola chathamensis TaxID=368405 RepID=UPI0036250C9D